MLSSRRRRLWFAALYFSEGAPIGWLWWALPSQLRRAGVEVDEITALTAALALPWTLKFLWAPLVDLLRSRHFGYRGWLVVAQLGMAATLLPMLQLDPVADWQLAFGLLLGHAFCAATQDVAIDGLAIATVPAGERGLLNGAMQAGMIGGRVLFSAGVLHLGHAFGAQVAVPGLLLVLAIVLLLVVAFPVAPTAPPSTTARPRHRRRRYLSALLLSRRIRRLALFALLGGGGFEAAGALSGSWLVDRGCDDADIGTFRLVAAALMVCGALFGGRLADRIGARRAAVRWSLLLGALLLALAALDAVDLDGAALAGYACVYFGIGGFTAASYALFMQNANGPLAATVFSAFMGLTNGCEALAGRLAGSLQTAHGYALAIGAPALLALAPLLLLRRGRRR